MFTYLSRQSKGDTTYATKTQTGSGRTTALLILNIGTRWRQVVDVKPWLFYPQERTLIPHE